jgi:ribonuclease BN (tRNA processing enzyme)
MPRDRHAWTEEIAARRASRRTEAPNRLVLLGTGGGSNPKATRCGYSNAVIVGDRAYIVDCGEGVHPQIHRAGMIATRRFGGIDRPVVESIFLTHLHADHIMDLVNVLQGAWPTTPIDVYGPGPAGPPFTTHDDPVHPVRFPDDPAPGIRSVIDHLNRALATNINARVIAEQRSDFIDQVRIHEIGLAGELENLPGDIVVDARVERPGAYFEVPPVEPFVVLPEDDHGVTVTATLVQHAPVFPAFAYRFDTPTGSVVFSGDTGSCDNVVQLAQGADILVHEVIDLEALLSRLTKLTNYETVRLQLGRSHTPADQVASIAHRAGVKTLVLSHLVPAEGNHSTDEWEAMVAAGCPEFEGEIVCGVDLDEYPIG